MSPDTRKNLGEGVKITKKSKIAQDKLNIDLKKNPIGSLDIHSIDVEPTVPTRTDSLNRRKSHKKSIRSGNCLNIFDSKTRSHSPESIPDPDSYKNLKAIISEANDNWAHFFLPLIHLANIDPTREKVNLLLENFKHLRNSNQKSQLKTTPSHSQLSISDSHLNKLSSPSKSFSEKNSSSSSSSDQSTDNKFNKLDALKNEIDKTINEISNFKNEVLHFESPRTVQMSEIGVNTDISMSNAVFKIKYEDEEEEEEEEDLDDTLKHATLKLNQPLIESPSESNSLRANHYEPPALTLLKNLNKKYNFLNISSVNESDISSPGPPSRKLNNKKFYKINNQVESDSLDDYKYKSKLNETSDYVLDEDNIFKKIFTRNLDQKNAYVNLEPVKKKVVNSSSTLSSTSSSDTYVNKRNSKTYTKKRESLLISEDAKKRNSLKKLPVFDFGAQKRNSNEYKLKIIPLKRSVTSEQSKFHCCCCKCTCLDAPLYQTVTTTITTTKIPVTVLKSSETSDSSKSDTSKNSDELTSYYFKSTKNHQKKNEFGYLSRDLIGKKSSGNYIKKNEFNFMLDSLEEEVQKPVKSGRPPSDNEFKFIKNIIEEEKSADDSNEAEINLVSNDIQFILDSLHRPHSSLQFANEEKPNHAFNTTCTLNDCDLGCAKSFRSYRNPMFTPRSNPIPEVDKYTYKPVRIPKEEFSTNQNSRKSPIRFPLPVNKESDYENFLSKTKLDKKPKKSKKLLKKTNDYQIHYPISSTDSSAINSPLLNSARRKPMYNADKNNWLNDYMNEFKVELDSPTLTDVNASNTQSESILLNSYKLV